MKIYTIFPYLPPKLDGIGDYTALLSTELAKSADVAILVDNNANADPIADVRIVPLFDANNIKSVWNIAKFVESDPPDWIFLQYNPFSYGKWGFNLELPRMLTHLKRTCPQTKIAVMAHETYVFGSERWQFAIMGIWQRYQMWKLVQDSSILFFSVESYINHVKRWAANKPTVHLPVGSNIPKIAIPQSDAKSRLNIDKSALVLGSFGNGFYGRHVDWIIESAENLHKHGHKVHLLFLGNKSEELARLVSTVPVSGTGRLSSEDISKALQSVDIYLGSYLDGVSTRRGSFVVGLQHGLCCVGTIGHNTGELLHNANNQALILTPVDDKAAFIQAVERLANNPELRSEIGKQAELFYDNYFDWQKTAQTVLENLSLL
jgi:glycosyltransferase involved in cell wall biosynthesis